MKFLYIFLCIAGLGTLSGAHETHRFIASCTGQGRAVIIAADGSVEWELDGLKTIQDSWQLPNGNFLFSHRRGIKEVSPDKRVVREYICPPHAELHSVQPLENGNLLASECGTQRLIEIDPSGKIVKEIPLKTSQKTHLQFRTARKTARGSYWVAFLGDSQVKEVDGAGTVLRQWTTGATFKGAHGVRELPGGNLLVSTGDAGGVKEFDPQGNLVWDLTREDLFAAGVNEIHYAGGVERLPNGNTLLSLYAGNVQLIEVTPDKKIVWKFYNPDLGGIAGFRLLDESKGE